MTARLYSLLHNFSFREVNKRNYELEAIKYNLPGRKVREHPLQLEGAEGAEGGAFGSQQKNVFQLGSKNRRAEIRVSSNMLRYI